MISIYKVNGKVLEFIVDVETDNLVEGTRKYLRTKLEDVYEVEKVMETLVFHGEQFVKVNFNGEQILASDGKHVLD